MLKNKTLKKIAITSGDQDGIGPEVTAKALAKIGPQKNILFFLWRSPLFSKKYLKLIDRRFQRITVSSWQEAQRLPGLRRNSLVDICSNAPAPKWVEWSAEAAHYRHLDALVTAPLSKTLIREAGMKDLGHTDILARVTGKKNLFMTFLGNQFHVLLITGHLPLAQVSSHISGHLVELALRAADQLGEVFKKPKTDWRVALLGLNPHAGESQIIGDEDAKILTPAINKALLSGGSFFGPLVPDAAFLKSHVKNYNIYVAPYHDQGLIPFKMAHEHGGCHLTMGLSFIRTSVDHGTAKDIFGKNKANSSSMQEALLRAILLCQNSFKPDQYLLAQH